MANKPKVVIIGGGFGGLQAAKELAGEAVDVTLIDKKNHHTFQPLLYQVATAVLSPGEIASPIRRILHKAKNIKVILGEAVGFDLEKRAVKLADDSEIAFDYLIVAAGARHRRGEVAVGHRVGDREDRADHDREEYVGLGHGARHQQRDDRQHQAEGVADRVEDEHIPAAELADEARRAPEEQTTRRRLGGAVAGRQLARGGRFGAHRAPPL